MNTDKRIQAMRKRLEASMPYLAILRPTREMQEDDVGDKQQGGLIPSQDLPTVDVVEPF